jgi:hypothetical protein
MTALAPRIALMTLNTFFFLVDMLGCPRWAAQLHALGKHEWAEHAWSRYRYAAETFLQECA